jgi:hypothetical protein
VFINLTNHSGDAMSVSVKHIVVIKDRASGGSELYVRSLADNAYFHVKESRNQILSMIPENTNGST